MAELEILTKQAQELQIATRSRKENHHHFDHQQSPAAAAKLLAIEMRLEQVVRQQQPPQHTAKEVGVELESQKPRAAASEPPDPDVAEAPAGVESDGQQLQLKQQDAALTLVAQSTPPPSEFVLQYGSTPAEVAVALTKQLAQLQIEECERQSALELEAERRRGMHTMKDAVMAAQQAGANELETALALLAQRHHAAAAIQVNNRRNAPIPHNVSGTISECPGLICAGASAGAEAHSRFKGSRESSPRSTG